VSREVASFLLSVTRLSGVVLTRGFASPPHDGYALVGKGLRRDRKICMAGARAAWEVSTGKGLVEPVRARRICQGDMGVVAGSVLARQCPLKAASRRNTVGSHQRSRPQSKSSPRNHERRGLANVSAANPFRLPRLHPGIGSAASPRKLLPRPGQGSGCYGLLDHQIRPSACSRYGHAPPRQSRSRRLTFERSDRCATFIATVRFTVGGVHGRAKKSRSSRSLSNVGARSPSSRPTSSA